MDNQKFYMLQNLSLKNVGDWPRLIKILGAILIFFIVLTLGYFLIIDTHISDVQAKKTEEISLKEQFESMHKLMQELKAYETHIKTATEQHQSVLDELPSELELSDLLRSISKIGEQNGLQFQSFKPMPEEQKEIYIESPYFVELTGTYQQFLQFAKALAELKNIALIKHFSAEYSNEEEMQASEQRLLKMSLLFSAFRYAPKPKETKDNQEKAT